VITASKTPDPGTPAPSPPPGGPTHPTPTGPGPQRYVDNLFALAASLGPDVALTFPSGGGRAGGVSSPAPGAVSGFVLPDTRVPLRFGEGRDRLVGCVVLGDGRPTPGQPGPPPPPPPTPFPPPGVGPLYDAPPTRFVMGRMEPGGPVLPPTWS